MQFFTNYLALENKQNSPTHGPSGSVSKSFLGRGTFFFYIDNVPQHKPLRRAKLLPVPSSQTGQFGMIVAKLAFCFKGDTCSNVIAKPEGLEQKMQSCQKWDLNPRLKERLRPEHRTLELSPFLTQAGLQQTNKHLIFNTKAG